MNATDPAGPGSPRATRASELMLLVVAAIWGSSYGVAKLALQYVPAMEFVALRFVMTFVVLLPALRPLLTGVDRRARLAAGSALGINLLAVLLCESFGVALTSAANAAFLISTCVVITPFVEWLMFGKRTSRLMLLCACLSLLGVALLTGSNGGTGAWARGEFLMLLAAVLRALLVCLTRYHLLRLGMPALTMTALQSGVAAAGACALVFIAGTPKLIVSAVAVPAFWGLMLYLACLCTVFAFFAQNFAASHVSPSRVSLLLGCEPAFGAVFAVIALNDHLTPTGWIGGALVVAAAWLATGAEAPHPSQRETLRSWLPRWKPNG
ncbi:DMT family transporter [Ideonella sp.]|uniref:DMT family transporter n=1 Tax=Ideonella sp. TaxID=1929293 RepID=UPI0035B13122